MIPGLGNRVASFTLPPGLVLPSGNNSDLISGFTVQISAVSLNPNRVTPPTVESSYASPLITVTLGRGIIDAVNQLGGPQHIPINVPVFDMSDIPDIVAAMTRIKQAYDVGRVPIHTPYPPYQLSELFGSDGAPLPKFQSGVDITFECFTRNTLVNTWEAAPSLEYSPSPENTVTCEIPLSMWAGIRRTSNIGNNSVGVTATSNVTVNPPNVFGAIRYRTTTVIRFSRGTVASWNAQLSGVLIARLTGMLRNTIDVRIENIRNVNSRRQQEGGFQGDVVAIYPTNLTNGTINITTLQVAMNQFNQTVSVAPTSAIESIVDCAMGFYCRLGVSLTLPANSVQNVMAGGFICNSGYTSNTAQTMCCHDNSDMQQCTGSCKAGFRIPVGMSTTECVP